MEGEEDEEGEEEESEEVEEEIPGINLKPLHKSARSKQESTLLSRIEPSNSSTGAASEELSLK